MATFFFYNNRKPRKYGYTPILYNEEEEARKKKLEKRVLEIKKEMGMIPEEVQKEEPKAFKSEFVSQTHHLRKRKDRESVGKGSFLSNNLVLILIIALLFAIFYFWIIR